MRILFVVEHFYPYIGGAEELWRSLSTSLVLAGHQVTVVTTRYNASLPKKDSYEGVDIVRVDVGNRFLFTLFSIPEVCRRARKSDLIHTSSYNSAFPAFVASFLYRKKAIITFHEVWGALWFKLPYKSGIVLLMYYLYEQFILKLPFHRFVAVSDFTAGKLAENNVSANKICRIYNGLNYENFKAYRHKAPEQFVFCFFGRLGISKGIDILLRASKRFLEEDSDAVLRLIIPTYPRAMYGDVLNMIDEFKIRSRIELLHDLPKVELLEQVSSSSCVVIPSHSEGFCFTAAEAVAMDIPVISSGRGALKEVVSGRFIELEELNDEELYKALLKARAGEWERRPAATFPLEETVQSYMELYNIL